MNLMTGGLGFAANRSDEDEELDQKIYRAATEAARRKFSPEFMNRIDKVIVFRALTRDHLEKILDIELTRVQQRIINATDGRQFVFSCTREARDFLLREGTDIKFGARHLKRSIERHLVFPISNLLATEQIQLGDLITVDFDSLLGKLIFAKEDQGALVHAEEEVPTEETALEPVSVRTAGASRALARRASREARP
jgi:ATP-dependent Clp protease ATP-binding subunit ClpA